MEVLNPRLKKKLGQRQWQLSTIKNSLIMNLKSQNEIKNLKNLMGKSTGNLALTPCLMMTMNPMSWNSEVYFFSPFPTMFGYLFAFFCFMRFSSIPLLATAILLWHAILVHKTMSWIVNSFSFFVTSWYSLKVLLLWHQFTLTSTDITQKNLTLFDSVQNFVITPIDVNFVINYVNWCQFCYQLTWIEKK